MADKGAPGIASSPSGFRRERDFPARPRVASPQTSARYAVVGKVQVLAACLSGLQHHVDVHGREGAQHATALCTLEQAELSQRCHIFVNALHVAPDRPAKLPHRQFTPALTSPHNLPALLRQLAKEVARTFKVQDFTLVSTGFG